MRHWIQKQILQKLAVSERLRYKELIPDDIEGNLFMYHVGQLKREGYLTKSERYYQLTDDGKAYVSKLSLTSGRLREQPKVVAMMVVQNSEQEFLMWQWKRQPYFDSVSLPFTKVSLHQDTSSAATEGLLNKTGISVEEWKWCGIAEVFSRLDHYVAVVYKAQVEAQDIVSDDFNGVGFWQRRAEISNESLLPGVNEVLDSSLSSVPFSLVIYDEGVST